ncbi:sialate O-acetylesterase [Arcicella lustrica]|uniref:Sialate O-acetylesterase n=1 Tax=Arcicella lustrica TaxID=2984196 RepID=A0ABU5SEG7_9BACT|nr:sialate O-acetylesterase [Arcicella sp. DC25W]MEA5425646.1 sialate O-acetylesterase [Arcicella sp. DC25W]
MKSYIILFILLTNIVAKGQVSLSLPLERSVFQRDNTGQTTVTFGGQAMVSTSTYQIQYKLVTLDRDGNNTNYNSQSWVNINDFGGGRTFQFNLPISTGWYRMYIRASQNNNQIGGTSSIKFGVGEVIVIAGQSNAQGVGPIPPPEANTSNSPYDCVISNNEQLFCKRSIAPFPIFGKMENSSRVGPNGVGVWAYQRLGNRIVDFEDGKIIPVLFFNVGASGTSVDNWSATADDQNAYVQNPLWDNNIHCNSAGVPTSENNGQGQPYIALRNTLHYYASMFGIRGILWHQGESNTVTNSSSATYASLLDNVIQKSRDHFNGNLAWAISNVSRINHEGIDKTSSNVLAGQNTSRTNKGGVIGAGNSDDIFDPIGSEGTKRQLDRTHFAKDGLFDLANQYFSNFGSLKAKTPIQSSSIPSISVTPNSSGGATLSVPSGYSEYRWVQYDGNYKDVDCSSSPSPCSNSITLASNSGNWRCYIKASNGNFMLTRKVYLPVTLTNARIASDKDVFLENESIIKSSVYPNPTYENFETTIAFELPSDANNLRLDIIDSKGTVIKTLANGNHAAGKYSYPFDIKELSLSSINVYYYRLTVDDIVETKRLLHIK